MQQSFNKQFRRKKDFYKVLTLQLKSNSTNDVSFLDSAFLPPIDYVNIDFSRISSLAKKTSLTEPPPTSVNCQTSQIFRNEISITDSSLCSYWTSPPNTHMQIIKIQS